MDGGSAPCPVSTVGDRNKQMHLVPQASAVLTLGSGRTHSLSARPPSSPNRGPVAPALAGAAEELTEPLLSMEPVPGPRWAQGPGVQWGCVCTQRYPRAELGRPASGVRPGIHFPGEGLPTPSLAAQPRARGGGGGRCHGERGPGTTPTPTPTEPGQWNGDEPVAGTGEGGLLSRAARLGPLTCEACGTH